MAEFANVLIDRRCESRGPFRPVWAKLGVSPMKSLCTLLLTAALCPATSSAQALWVVDGSDGPGTDFLDLPPAIAAAAPGDVVLVRAVDGVFYSAFTLDKALSIVSDPEPVTGNVYIPTILGSSVIENVAGPLPVRLHLFALSSTEPNSPVLTVRDCSAPVMLEGLSVEGQNFTDPDDLERYTVSIESCSQVVLSRFSVESFGGFQFHERGPRGLRAVDSTIHMYQTVIKGARGEDAYFLGGSFGVIEATPGEDGAHVDGGRLFMVESEVRGHRGGAGLLHGGTCHEPGNGGDGLVMTGGAELVRFDSVASGGAAGTPAGACSASSGIGLQPSGPVTNLGGDAPFVFAERLPWREGETVRYDFSSDPGDLLLLVFGVQMQPVELMPLGGLLVPQFGTPLVLGVVPASGEFELSVGVPALPPGESVRTVYLQAVHANASGAALGTPMAATWLGAGL